MNRFDNRVAVAALVLVCLLAVRLLAVPAWRETARVREEIARLREETRALVELGVRYEARKADLAALLSPREAAAFLPQIEAKVRDLGLAGRLRTVAPVSRELAGGVRAEGFDLRLEELDLREAVLLLEALEGVGGLYLDRAIMDRSRDGRTLAVRVRVLTIRRS